MHTGNVAKAFGRLSGREHRAAYREGTRYANEFLVIYARPSRLTVPRVGVSVSKVFGGAVRRNRVKRKVREACYRQREVLPAGVDLVVIPLAPAADTTVSGLADALGRLLTTVEIGQERPGGHGSG